MLERLDTRGLELLEAIPSDKMLAMYDFEGRSMTGTAGWISDCDACEKGNARVSGFCRETVCL